MSSLSSLIVQSEVATMRQVEEALARQVIYGGDLVTNLMEVTPIDEQALVALLADSVGLPPAPARELPLPSDELRSLVPADVAIACAALPLSADESTLVVAVAEPLSAESVTRLGGPGAIGGPASGAAAADSPGNRTELWRARGTPSRTVGCAARRETDPDAVGGATRALAEDESAPARSHERVAAELPVSRTLVAFGLCRATDPACRFGRAPGSEHGGPAQRDTSESRSLAVERT